MTYQDEFARPRRNARGAETGEGEASRHCEERSDEAIQSGERRTGLLRYARNDEPMDTAEKRHPELVSGPRTGEPDDGGKADEVLKQVQDDEVHTPTTRHDGWLPELRVKFLEALARTGNVGAAALFVQRSRQSAYDLKRRDPDFARVWLAALVLAREVAQDVLQERAIEGVEEEIFYHGEVVATRRRYDSRLLLAHLARLDKIAGQIPAQRGAARFAEMLDAIGKGEDTAPLIATPTEDELAEAAAEAEKYPHQRQPAEEERDEFYMVTWPEDDEDDRPDLLRMCPEEVEQMQREVPGIVITPTGTRDEEAVELLIELAEDAYCREELVAEEEEEEEEDEEERIS